MTDYDELVRTRDGLPRHTLTTWRAHFGVSKGFVALKANVSVASLIGYEMGRKMPTVDIAQRIATALGVYADQLVWLECEARDSPANKTARCTDSG